MVEEAEKEEDGVVGEVEETEVCHGIFNPIYALYPEMAILATTPI